MKVKLKLKGLDNEGVKMITFHSNSSVKLRHIARAINSSKLASWAFVLSLLLQLVSGERREALVRVQPGGIEVRGEYSRSGPNGINASGLIQTVSKLPLLKLTNKKKFVDKKRSY